MHQNLNLRVVGSRTPGWALITFAGIFVKPGFPTAKYINNRRDYTTGEIRLVMPVTCQAFEKRIHFIQYTFVKFSIGQSSAEVKIKSQQYVFIGRIDYFARLAQSVDHDTLNLSPTRVGR